MNWSIVFFFIFLFSLIVLAVGTKNPKIIFPNKDISRIRFFLGSLFASFLLLSFSVALNPPSQKVTDLDIPTLSPPSPIPTLFQTTETSFSEVESAQTTSAPVPTDTPTPTPTSTPKPTPTVKISTPTPKSITPVG